MFNARHTGGECKHFQVPDWKKKEKKSPDGSQTKTNEGGGAV